MNRGGTSMGLAHPRTGTTVVVRFIRPRQSSPTLRDDLLDPPGRVLVQQAGDQRLVRQPLRKRPLLNRFQVLARQSNVQPPVLAERGLRVTGVPRVFALAALRGR